VRRLRPYRVRRDVDASPEPDGRVHPAPGPDRQRPRRGRGRWEPLAPGRRFVVQLHRASQRHVDLRVEHGGGLRSWAVPRGPSLDPHARRLAVEVEEHPVDDGGFEGEIPSGYGAGTVRLWDLGTILWTGAAAGDVDAAREAGHLDAELAGTRLAGTRLRSGFTLASRAAEGRRRPAAAGGTPRRSGAKAA